MDYASQSIFSQTNALQMESNSFKRKMKGTVIKQAKIPLHNQACFFIIVVSLNPQGLPESNQAQPRLASSRIFHPRPVSLMITASSTGTNGCCMSALGMERELSSPPPLFSSFLPSQGNQAHYLLSFCTYYSRG